MSFETIKRDVKICMFDQYGTVVDMQGGLIKIAAPFLAKKGWKGDPNSFVTWWRRTHFENSMIDVESRSPSAAVAQLNKRQR